MVEIIKLGKQEWKLYIIAFCSLLIAALSKFNNYNFNQYVYSTIFFQLKCFCHIFPVQS